MKPIALALVLGLSAVASADPTPDLAGTPIEAFTITAPGVTISRDEQFVVTVKQKGKPTKTLTSTDNGTVVHLADGTLVYLQTSEANNVFLDIKTSDGNKLGDILESAMLMRLDGKKKRVSFNAKGVLVGSASKITLKPASLAAKGDALLIVAALLRDKI